MPPVRVDASAGPLLGFRQGPLQGGITIGRRGSCQNGVDVVVLAPRAASTEFVDRPVMGDGSVT